MCSNFEIKGTPSQLKCRFELEVQPEIIDKVNLRPTNLALIINSNKKPEFLTWGIPILRSINSSKKVIINARAETLTEKKIFQKIIEKRCVIPATAWFEWRQQNGYKLKNRISVENSPIFSFAGLIHKDHFVIITCPPSPSIMHIHNRMPVILTSETEERWLNPRLTHTKVAHLLEPSKSALKIEEEEPLQRNLLF